jgi:hypothetical protein
MKQQYYTKQLLGWCGVLLVWLLMAAPAAAQTPALYGNEWIVPSQQYYKIKVTKDALYRIDQQYLAQAGISGVNPQRIQLWRRGRELAIHAGGNQATLDATTFFEFYGQRNDGKLDQAIYKGGAAAQPHDLYSLYTDTAAYFLTWSATTNGKRMTAVATTPTATPHATRLAQRQLVYVGRSPQEPGEFAYVNDEPLVNVYQPWGEAGEGFLSVEFGGTNGFGGGATMLTDSAWAVARTVGTVPQVELVFVGAWSGPHTVQVSVVQPSTGTERVVGSVSFNGYEKRTFKYPLQSTDISGAGAIRTIARVTNPAVPNQRYGFRVGYVRYTFPQASRWRAGLKQMAFRNDSTLAGPAYYAVDSIPATVRGFDLTDIYNMQRVEGIALAGQQRGYSFPSATATQTRHLLLVDEAQAVAPRPAKRVQFRSLNAAASNFLIITHSTLMRPVNGVDAVRAYATYRASTLGGRYDTAVVTSEQLYNQFHYGEKSVGAMRNFVRWELANSPASQTNYLLILGKGLIVAERRQGSPLDLVPSTTRSGSDNFLSANWENNQYTARMPTGRLPAVTPQEIIRYLDKLKTHEALGAEPWRKNIVHLGGGDDVNQQLEFENYLDRYKRLAEKPLFGGTVVNTYRRRLSGGTNLPVNMTIAPEINAGVSLVTYFGHGSTSTFDLNFGDPTEPSKGYNNPGKYPVFLLNGCAANAVDRNNSTKTVSENWIFAENKGAVGFMAASDEAFTYDLNTFSTEFYKLAFNEPAWYGKPIPVLQAEANRRMLITNGGGGSTIALALMNTWLGDPALRLYAPERPDFITSNADLQLQPNGAGQIQASSPNFKLLVRVSNPGKITYDSLDIRITRTYPVTTGRVPDIKTYTVRQAWHDSTYTFVLPNTGNVFGDNRFEVALDYRNRVTELSETNNTGQINFNFLQGGVRTVWPPEFAIVPPTNLRLVGQNNDPRGTSRVYEMELDTVPTFTSASPIKQTRTITTTLVPDWRPTLPTLTGRDSVVWYWRLRFQTPVGDESPEWATSSFRVIQNTAGGWSQSHHGQFRRDQLAGMSVAAPSGRWDFADISEPISLATRGGGTGPGQTFNALTDGISTSASPYVANCGPNYPNIMVAVFSGQTLRPVRNVAGAYDSCGQGNLRYYHFATSATDNINTAARQAQLQALLTNVRPGDYIALISMNRVNFSSFPASLKTTLTSLGAVRINTLQDGEPYALLVQKGPNPRVVREVAADPANPTPSINQVVTLNAALLTRAGSGSVTSTRIGPAQQWQNLYHTVRTPDATDQYTLKLIGIDTLNVERVLEANVTSRNLALSNISAQQYPYLQLVLELRDTLNRTAPQLKQWLVTYQGVPEGIVRRDLATPASAYDPATLARQAGETGFVTVPVVFQNVSSINFSGPMKARILLRNESNGVKEALIDVPGGALQANSQVSFEAKVNVVGLAGSLSGNVVVNPGPRPLPELYAFNNELVLDAFRVDDRNVPPTLDVAFDGLHILNGDIVSPAPTITVQLRDDDRLRRIQGASNFDVLLTSPNQTTSRIDLTGSNVRFSADSTKGTAQLELRMGQNTPLDNGIYTLEVQGRDATGKAAAAEPYRITFEVINESTISNIYPYPNPVTSKTRFVFTLTGTEPPRNMKIQVLTLTGRVVREIMMAELGPLRIGNNISEYAWDGTDQFGDRLANGTYLYRVMLDDPQDKFSRRATAGDQAFKKDWGKIVLLR